MLHNIETDRDEPSLDDLAAIESEWPEIEAGLAELDAEIAALNGHPVEPDWQRYRREERRVLRRLAVVADRHVCSPLRLVEAEMSDCPYGCKVFACPDCGLKRVVHYGIYGCPAGRAA